MSKSYMGIDPGSKGFIAIQTNDEFEHYALAGLDLYELADLFTGIKAAHPNIVCVIEDVRAIHGSASTATFSFGMNKGALLVFLCAFRIPYEQVLPQVWQRSMWTNSDIVKKKTANGLTEKQESFCIEYVDNGGNASEAYRVCYDCSNMQPQSVWQLASRLLDNVKVMSRIAEIKAERAKRAERGYFRGLISASRRSAG